MIHYTKIVRASLILFTFCNISCKLNEKKENDNISADSVFVEKKQEHIPKKESQKNKWVYIKSLPLSSDYSCENDKFIGLQVSISLDSLFINNKYTDDVFKGIVKSKHFFKDKYPLEIYKNLLKNEFSLSISDSVSYIRNKKAYDKSSELNNYFQDAFFIENYMFFEDNGCVVCFTKDNIKSVLTKSCLKKSNTAFPYNKKHPINNIKYEILECDIIGIKDFLCGEEKLRYISLPAVKNIDIIMVPMDCGDSPYRFYLLSIHANKVISNLYVEGELYEPETQGNVDVTSFSINKNYVIQVSTKKNIDNKLQYEEIKKYQINKNGEILSIN